MKRREFTAVLGGAALAGWLPANAQQAGKMHRIGVILGGPPVADAPNVAKGLVQGLHALGYVESKNLVLEWRSAEGRYEHLPQIVRELVSANVDILLATTHPVAQAAKNATQTIPIVMVLVPDPVGSGLVVSLSRPGGNLTGLTHISAEISGKRLALLKELLPELARVTILTNPSNAFHPTYWRETQGAATKLGVALHPVEVRRVEDFDAAFAAAARAKAEALVAFDDPLTFQNRRQIVDLAAKARLPTMYGFREFPDDGGLISYGANVFDLFKRSAVLVDKILRGAKPAELPVEQPTKFDFIVNLMTANALGLTIPPSFLARADEVIE